MTEKDYEIQSLRRENALLKKSRDLFKEQFYSEARKNEKLKNERDALMDLVPRKCCYCGNSDNGEPRTLSDGITDDLCKDCIRNQRINWVWGQT